MGAPNHLLPSRLKCCDAFKTYTQFSSIALFVDCFLLSSTLIHPLTRPLTHSLTYSFCNSPSCRQTRNTTPHRTWTTTNCVRTCTHLVSSSNSRSRWTRPCCVRWGALKTWCKWWRKWGELQHVEWYSRAKGDLSDQVIAVMVRVVRWANHLVQSITLFCLHRARTHSHSLSP